MEVKPHVPVLSLLMPVNSPYLKQTQLFSAFTELFWPCEQVHLSGTSERGRCLVHTVFTICAAQELVDNSIRALVLAYFADSQNDQALSARAMHHYGRSLMLLNAALADATTARSDETLLATVFLALYEMWPPATLPLWIKHADAIATLIKMRVPDRHKNGIGREIFDACRGAIVYASLESYTDCFLAQPEWSSFLEDDRGEQADPNGLWARASRFLPESELLDRELATLTSLAQRVRNITKQKTSVDSTSAESLRNEMLSSRRNLGTISKRIENTLEQLRPQAERAPLNVADTYAPIAGFIDVYIATIRTSYWHGLILVNSLMRSLEPDPENIAAYKLAGEVLKRDSFRVAEELAASRYSRSFTVRTRLYIIQRCIPAIEV